MEKVRSLINLNILFFLAYSLIGLLELSDKFFFFNLAYLFIKTVIIFFLVGFNITALLQIYFKQKFDIAEFLSLSFVIALLFPAFLLTIEYSKVEILSANLPIANSFFIFLVTVFTFYYKQDKFDPETKNLEFRMEKKMINTLLTSPFFWILILYTSISIIVFSTYHALPDMDPFYWIQRYSKDFSENIIVKITSDRPLFSSLTYILSQSLHFEIYNVFKYIIPSLSVLVVIPAWMVSRKFSSKISQIAVMLLPLASSSTILYLQTPMPQEILTILCFYFFFFLIYSWLSNRKLFFYLAGIIILLSYFYHETAMIIFVVWLLVILLLKHKYLLNQILNNKLITFLLVLLFLSNFSFVKVGFIFITHWIKIIITAVPAMIPNFHFPAYYVNMNGQSMGWSGFSGVTKYYSYYTGPLLISIILYFFYLSFKNKNFRENVRTATKNEEVIVLMILFFIFFFISELMPRFCNMALLPDRSWIFTGLFLTTFFFIIAKHLENKNKYYYLLTILAISVSIGGSFYINNLKKYIITNEKISSAEWIKNNLPENRFLFTDLDRNMLKFYGKSEVIKVPTEFFFDYKIAEKEINKYLFQNESMEDSYLKFVESNKKISNEFEHKDPFAQKDLILTLLKNNISQSLNMDSTLKSETDLPNHNFYIYYSKPHRLNPYINRPYYKENSLYGDDFVFNKYPEKFHRIYTDKKNNIFIWKVL